MTDIFQQAVAQTKSAKGAFCKFISANDLGLTGGHQSGFYVSKSASKVLFDCDSIKGTNVKKAIFINWNNCIDTESSYTYYGKESRDEARITKFGRGFEFMDDIYLGSLLIGCRLDADHYAFYVLNEEEDINEFLAQFNIPINNRCTVISNHIQTETTDRLQELLDRILDKYSYFPETGLMSKLARDSFNTARSLNEKQILNDPDGVIIDWINTESSLFFQFEERIYSKTYSHPFSDCQTLIQFANEILNRRKSRAGKSLEHHLSEMFTRHQLKFDEQCVTEGNKKPDFLFPGANEYHNPLFPAEDLTLLGAKTTCKDRWRQVLNEGDRIDHKFIFTLQQGVSSNQIDEMRHEHLQLVVPKSNLNCFAAKDRADILTLSDFIDIVKSKQNKHGIIIGLQNH